MDDFMKEYDKDENRISSKYLAIVLKGLYSHLPGVVKGGPV